MNKTLYIAFLFFTLLLLQVFIFNNVLFLGYVNPYIYIAFVFLYPIRKNRFPFLFLSFLLGLCVDAFSNSGGINAFSILFIAYIRIFFIRSIFKKIAIEDTLFSINKEPFGNTFNYVIVLTLIHHFILFSLANFSFQNISHVLLNTILSSIFTVILFLLGNYIFSPKQTQ